MQTVVDLTNATGNWNLNKLKTIMSSNIMHELISLNTTSAKNGKDVCMWKRNQASIFTVKSAYNIINSNDTYHDIAESWKSIQKLGYQKGSDNSSGWTNMNVL